MKISKEKMQECLGRLGVLRQFPSGSFAQAEIGKAIDEVCATDADATRLVDDVIRQFDAWPGPVNFSGTRARRRPNTGGPIAKVRPAMSKVNGPFLTCNATTRTRIAQRSHFTSLIQRPFGAPVWGTPKRCAADTCAAGVFGGDPGGG